MLRRAPSIVAGTGRVIADGINGPGFGVAAARAALASFVPAAADQPITDRYSLYGCNMAFRVAPICAHHLRFDENLPLYGWAEDVDFSRQIAPYGRIVANPQLIGVR